MIAITSREVCGARIILTMSDAGTGLLFQEGDCPASCLMAAGIAPNTHVLISDEPVEGFDRVPPNATEAHLLGGAMDWEESLLSGGVPGVSPR